jgi:hypothetical protein
MTRRKAPADLGQNGAKIWREMHEKYQFRVDEERVLFDACCEADLIDDMAAPARGAERIVRGSQGQPVINPLISELRQHRATLASLLKQLNLPDQAGSHPGSVSGSPRSTQARSAALTRWHGKP